MLPAVQSAQLCMTLVFFILAPVYLCLLACLFIAVWSSSMGCGMGLLLLFLFVFFKVRVEVKLQCGRGYSHPGSRITALTTTFCLQRKHSWLVLLSSVNLFTRLTSNLDYLQSPRCNSTVCMQMPHCMKGVCSGSLVLYSLCHTEYWLGGRWLNSSCLALLVYLSFLFTLIFLFASIQVLSLLCDIHPNN